MRILCKVLIVVAVVAYALPAFAQEPVGNGRQLKIRDAKVPHNAARGGIHAEVAPSSVPNWQYSLVARRDGHPYTGSIVGGRPSAGAGTTTVDVVVIPLRIVFTGTLRTFDPTFPDIGCLGVGNTAMSLTQQSPILSPVTNYMMNGVNLGTVTLPDAFQRASFWSAVSTIAPSYHLAFNVTTQPPQVISMPNNSSGPGATYTFGGDCSTNTTSQVNPPRLGVVDINFMDVQLNNIIVSLGITPNQFPLFLMYGVVMSEGPPLSLSGNCCILGYHNGSGIVAAPGQTYGIAGYDQGYLFGGVKDISILSHEVMEWVNDPSTNNLTPPWGNLGQVSGCQNNLETGDPLTGLLEPSILMPNGITYHPQEQAFFPWFFGGPWGSAGNKYSSNGTFTGLAKLCPPGGSN